MLCKAIALLYSCIQVFLCTCILVYIACFLYGRYCNKEMQENKGLTGYTPDPTEPSRAGGAITLSIFKKNSNGF